MEFVYKHKKVQNKQTPFNIDFGTPPVYAELPYLGNDTAANLDGTPHILSNEQLDCVGSSTDLIVKKKISNSTGVYPSTESYPGPFEFSAQLPPGTTRRTWAYSEELRKVFINVDKVLLMQFKMNIPNDVVSGMKVRALLVYSTADHINLSVDRCALHWVDSDPEHLAHQDKGKCLCAKHDQVGHIIRSDNVDASYEFDLNSKRHSVTVPVKPLLPEYGDTIIAYRFGCKTSCQGGMARRPISIIFTLESNRGDVVGRCSMSLKICSCPKRDKEREELDKKRGNPVQTPVKEEESFMVSTLELTPRSAKRVADSLLWSGERTNTPSSIQEQDARFLTSSKKMKLDQYLGNSLRQQYYQPNELANVNHTNRQNGSINEEGSDHLLKEMFKKINDMSSEMQCISSQMKYLTEQTYENAQNIERILSFARGLSAATNGYNCRTD